jgi:hypothetical protein
LLGIRAPIITMAYFDICEREVEWGVGMEWKLRLEE